MAHNVTATDNLFTVRQPAWHRLGVVLDHYPSREEAQSIAHPWEPVDAPLFRRVLHADLTETYEPVETHRELVRSDNGQTLGVVSSSYTLTSNSELYDIAEALQGTDAEVRFETGGSLMGGSKVWLLLRLNEPLFVQGDPNGASIAYYALQNSHDGSTSLRGQGTMTRIVCDNTAHMADLDATAKGTEFSFRHTVGVKARIEEAKAALAGWREGIRNWTLQAAQLLAMKADAEQREDFVKIFIPMPKALITERVRNNVEDSRAQLRSIMAGATQEGISSTAYGMVQAAIEYNQHYRATRSATPEGRLENLFRRSYLDPSEVTKAAVDLALELVA